MPHGGKKRDLVMRKFILFVLLICVFSGCAGAAAEYELSYSWADEAVQFCVSSGIMTGDENGDLMLGESLTQAQACAMTARAMGLDTAGKTTSLVGTSHWAYRYVAALSSYIVLPDSFSADKPASREMYIALLTSAAGIAPAGDSKPLKDHFADAAAVKFEYLPYITAAYESGLIIGDGTMLNPKSNLTRAEAAVLLERAGNNLRTHTPIIGSPEVTLEQAKRWASAKGAADIYINIADIYWKYGQITGIRPDLLYAQAGKETGYGNYTGKVKPEMNNWAGIKKYGATGDETEDHETFATPDDGVRAHFNHICAYVGLAPIGEPHGRYNSVMTLSWAGTITEMEQLGGKWCPDVNYGTAVVKMVEEMKKY